MQHKVIFKIFLMALSVMLISSCQKETERIIINERPVASAGVDQILTLPINYCILDGTGSYDHMGRPVTFLWKKIEGPSSYLIEKPDSARTRVNDLVEGVYKFELTVTNDRNLHASDTIQIAVKASDGNVAPTAVAGPDLQITLPVNFCDLDGTGSFGADGSALAFQWKKVSGPISFSIQSPMSAKTRVSDLVEGVYEFELIVSDNKGMSGRDSVFVSVIYPSQCDLNGRPQKNISLTPIGRLSKTRVAYVGAAGNKLVFAGGAFFETSGTYNVSSVVDIYDLVSKTWSTANLSSAREGIAVVTSGNKIFFAGGGLFDMPSSDIDIYDADANTWKTINLKQPRMNLAAAAVGSKVIFAGGYTEGWQASSKVDIYNTETGNWTTADLSIPRYDICAVTVGNKVYFAGGTTNTGPSNRIDIYDVTTDTWTSSSLLQVWGAVSGVLSGNSIYWTGKALNENKQLLERLTLEDNAATNVGCLSDVRAAPPSLQRNDELLFFTTSYWNNNEPLRNSVDIYNTVANSWTIGKLNQAVAGASLIKFKNEIYMGGGKVGSSTCSDMVYIVNW